jgi:hypothetical protein
MIMSTANTMAFFAPFTALMGFHLLVIQPTHGLPMTTTGNLSTIMTDPSNFTVTFEEQRDLSDADSDALATTTPDLESLQFAAFSVQHMSTLESLFEKGSHLFDPFVHFIQALVGGPPAQEVETPRPTDKRMLYMV